MNPWGLVAKTLIAEQDPTYIGQVKHVLGSTVTVELDANLAGVAPIYRGHLQQVGQIGSLVRIPQGLVDLIGAVNLLGISELSGVQEPMQSVQNGDRWLQVQLLGEVDRGTGRFGRGVAAYPGLDDPVHFTTIEDLLAVFPDPDEQHVRLGRLSASENISVCLNLDALVLRHSAVVGATGSGKTSAVASILQGLVRGGWGAANIVVIDPHGEYARALETSASVRRVLESEDRALNVPFWALPAEEILRAFIGTAGATAVRRFSELVTEARRAFVKKCDWLDLDPAQVTSDIPVPFNLHDVWYKLAYENSATYEKANDESTVKVTDTGDAASLKPAQFKPYGAGSTPPHRGPYFNAYGNIPNQLRLGLLDPRLRFLHRVSAPPEGPDPLIGAAQEWLGGTKAISVLDFSGVPAHASDVAIGAILTLLFELALRSNPEGPGIGRPNPVLIVLEEAHRYLGQDAAVATREATSRIAREGRKYGVGLMLVSQRPSELPDTALSQCGTLIALRLTNSTDQGRIRSALPDSIEGLAAVLPSLRTGEAIVSGEAVTLPVRVLVNRPNPMPQSADPSTGVWRQPKKLPDVTSALQEWRGIYQEETKP